jgi:hypothetical protein
MVLTSKPEIEIDAALLTEDLVEIYFTPAPNVMAWKPKKIVYWLCMISGHNSQGLCLYPRLDTCPNQIRLTIFVHKENILI